MVQGVQKTLHKTINIGTQNDPRNTLQDAKKPQNNLQKPDVQPREKETKKDVIQLAKTKI